MFSIDPKQAGPLIQKMTEESQSHYQALNDNCADACSKAVETAGLDPGYTRSPLLHERYGQPYRTVTLSPIPNVRYDEMIKNNSSKLVTTIEQ